VKTKDVVVEGKDERPKEEASLVEKRTLQKEKGGGGNRERDSKEKEGVPGSSTQI